MISSRIKQNAIHSWLFSFVIIRIISDMLNSLLMKRGWSIVCSFYSLIHSKRKLYLLINQWIVIYFRSKIIMWNIKSGSNEQFCIIYNLFSILFSHKMKTKLSNSRISSTFLLTRIYRKTDKKLNKFSSKLKNFDRIHLSVKFTVCVAHQNPKLMQKVNEQRRGKQKTNEKKNAWKLWKQFSVQLIKTMLMNIHECCKCNEVRGRSETKQ